MKYDSHMKVVFRNLTTMEEILQTDIYRQKTRRKKSVLLGLQWKEDRKKSGLNGWDLFLPQFSCGSLNVTVIATR